MSDETIKNKPLFVKLMQLSTSTNDGEALTALRKANALLTRSGMNWEQLLDAHIIIAPDPFLSAPPPPTTRYGNGSGRTAPIPPRPQPAPPPRPTTPPPPRPPYQAPPQPTTPPYYTQQRRKKRAYKGPITLDDI